MNEKDKDEKDEKEDVEWEKLQIAHQKECQIQYHINYHKEILKKEIDDMFMTAWLAKFNYKKNTALNTIIKQLYRQIIVLFRLSREDGRGSQKSLDEIKQAHIQGAVLVDEMYLQIDSWLRESENQTNIKIEKEKQKEKKSVLISTQVQVQVPIKIEI